MTGREARAAALTRLLATLAEAAGCDTAGCPAKSCLCRAQAAAVRGAFWLRSRPVPALPRRYSTEAARAATRGRDWTAPEVAALRDAWAVLPVLSLRQIAARIGRSFWGVKAKAAEQKLRRHDWGPGRPRAPGRNP